MNPKTALNQKTAPAKGIDIDIQQNLGNFHLNVQLSLPATGMSALFGKSGSGKSSVLKAIAGLNPFTPKMSRLRTRKHTAPNSLNITINGEIWHSDNIFIAPHKRALGYVFQEAHLFNHLSVQQNLLYGWQRIAPEHRRIHPEQVYTLLGLSHLFSRDTAHLSGGERQRIAIGRALLTSPQLLLMDEPLSALDQQAKQQILPYLENLNDQLDIPAIYVSHDPNEVARLANTMAILDNGTVKAIGDAANLLTRLDLAPSRYGDAAAILEGYVSHHDDSFALTWINILDGQLAICRENIAVGKRARIKINARDVSLSLRSHSDSTIINTLRCTIVGSKDINPSQLIMRLQTLDKQFLLARITRRSALALELKEGMSVYAQVKGVALVT